MPLRRGSRIGGYEIHSQLGAGGMGEVYRARDIKLGRDVAIKILPLDWAADADRLSRFEREARLLASLNHSNIGSIYGLEDGGGSPALVLELIEGDALADRVRRGPLPPADAVAIARQIADALDAAHERGIVHRDLKPANVKITPDGVVKVLDFGLAKAMAPDPDSEAARDLATSPTVTMGGTGQGVILGTAAYMSPEQARGKAVDKRTDIWAFGCVLFEMLTGRRAFAGETTSDIIAVILGGAPEWTALPPATPAPLRRILERCLEKDPKRRVRDIGDVRRDLDEEMTPPAVPLAADPGISAVTVALTGMVVLLSAVAVGLWLRPVQPPPPARFTFAAPEGLALGPGPAVPSPDGTRIAFVARNSEGQRAIWIRPLDAAVSTRLPGTEGATGMTFWSPDGRFVGFVADGKLKKVDTTGGPAVTICATQANLGATWGADNVIVFAPHNRTSLHRVSAAGGTPEAITTLNAERENSHRWPHFLPDGRRFLFTARSDVKENNLIYMGSLDSPEISPLRAAQSNAVYVPPGFLLFVQDETLMAQPFDARAGAASGEPLAVAASVRHNTPSSEAWFAAAGNGSVLTYLPAVQADSRLTWFDRAGVTLGTVGPVSRYDAIRLSPDGLTAALDIPDPDSGTRDIWLLDTGAGSLTRLTTNPATDWVPVWAPDGKHIAFASDRNGRSTIFRKATDGSGEEELLLRMDGGVFPNDWSRDGQWLLFHTDRGAALQDLGLMALGDRRPKDLLRTNFRETGAKFSPDGRWIAYESNESGATEIYLKPIAGPGKIKISTGGGTFARWRRDGQELFFVAPGDRIMSGMLTAPDKRAARPPTVLFTACDARGGAPYDVAPDGKRFLVICAGPAANPSAVHVLANWSMPVPSRKP